MHEWNGCVSSSAMPNLTRHHYHHEGRQKQKLETYLVSISSALLQLALAVSFAQCSIAVGMRNVAVSVGEVF
jgi:hypothetical protein